MLVALSGFWGDGYPDVCRTTPLVVQVNWPSLVGDVQRGKLWVANRPLVTGTFSYDAPIRFTGTDKYGCVTTVIRPW